MSRKISLILFALGAVLAACRLPLGAQPTPTLFPQTPLPSDTTPLPPTVVPPTGEIVTGSASIESLEVLILESFPVQVNLLARGSLPDGCTSLEPAQIRQQGSTFFVTLPTSRPADAMCTAALVPFEQVISLPVHGLLAGEYTVDLNGVTAAFTLQVDNISPAEAQPGSISGVLWHDLCSLFGLETDPETPLPQGCVYTPEKGFRADGLRGESEPPIAGVVLALGAGACPSTGLATATTDEQGRYTFTVDSPGTYCLSIDPLAQPNAGILADGDWTFPSGGQASQTVTLQSPGEARSDLDFGWDYQNLPLPEVVNPPDCTDQATFVEDVTVPDDSEFAAGGTFVKTWRLRNSGTCTWTPEYALTFERGDQMGASSPIPLSTVVPPEQTVDLSVELTAPNVSGTYRGDWLLQNADGETFGLGKNASDTFWVQIVVIEEAVQLDLGDPDWTDTFSSGANWFLVDTANTKFTVEDGSLVMTAAAPGALEEWGLSHQPELSDFYLEVTFTTGKTCSGLDRYGVLLRAPDPNAGYVFGISCDGRFRLYKWDGENYNPLQEWKRSPSLQAGPEQTNVIGFWAQGDTLRLFANGNQIAEFNDDTYSKGRFGLLIGSANTEDFTVYVEKVQYWHLFSPR